MNLSCNLYKGLEPFCIIHNQFINLLFFFEVFLYYGIRASKFLTDGLSKYLSSLHIYSPSPPSPPPSNPHLQFALHLHHQPLPLVYSPPPPSTPPQVHSPPIPVLVIKRSEQFSKFYHLLIMFVFLLQNFFFFSMKLSFYMISDLKVCYFLIVFFFSFTKLFFLHEAVVLHDMRASNWLLPYRVFFLHEVFFLHDTKASKFVILLSTFSLMKLLFLHEDFPHIISKSQNLLLFYHFFLCFTKLSFFLYFTKLLLVENLKY